MEHELDIISGKISKDRIHMFVGYRPTQNVRQIVQLLKGGCLRIRMLLPEFAHLRTQFWVSHLWISLISCNQFQHQRRRDSPTVYRRAGRRMSCWWQSISNRRKSTHCLANEGSSVQRTYSIRSLKLKNKTKNKIQLLFEASYLLEKMSYNITLKFLYYIKQKAW